MVIFGASGDLTHRLLPPALYNLARARRMPNRFRDHRRSIAQDWSDVPQFRSYMAEGSSNVIPGYRDRVRFASRSTPTAGIVLAVLHDSRPGDVDRSGTVQGSRQELDEVAAQYGIEGNVIFYLAVAQFAVRTDRRAPRRSVGSARQDGSAGGG